LYFIEKVVKLQAFRTYSSSIKMDNQSRDLLDADELLAEPLRPASRTKRLLNLLIDTVFFYILVISIASVTALINPSVIETIEQTNPLVDRVIYWLFFMVYYVIFETWLGKTPGKMITKTKVVDKNGQKPNFTTVAGRSFSRLIPFEAFSFLRENPIGIHDRMAHTMVVDDRPDRSFDWSIRTMPD